MSTPTPQPSRPPSNVDAAKLLGAGAARVGRGLAGIFRTAAKSIGDTYTSAKRAEMAAYVEPMEQELLAAPKTFDIDATARHFGRSVDALKPARVETYRRFLVRWTKDGHFSPNDVQRNAWLLVRLRLAPGDTRGAAREVLLPYFNAALTRAVSDGKLDPNEHAELERVAGILGEPLSSLAGRWFGEHGDILASRIFGDALDAAVPPVEDLDRAERRIGAITHALGVDDGAWRAIVADLCVRSARVAMTHCRTDHRSVPGLRALVDWIAVRPGIDPVTRAAIATEMGRIETLAAIEAGRLPSLTSETIIVESGELVHYEALASAVVTKTARSGNTIENRLQGACVITDTRLVVVAGTEAFTVKHRVVSRATLADGTVRILTSKRLVSIAVEDPELALAVLRRAIAHARGFKPAADLGIPTRHIPRDVRQRVWVKYGGRCADCHAESYLEFDHIVPVAKGGSNSEANVQLLCRGCNGKKSDRI